MRKNSETANKIILGDCRDILRGGAIEPNSISVIHTSPPYNIGKKYHSYRDKSELDSYLTFIKETICLSSRVLKEGGSFFWQTGYTQDGQESKEIIPIDFLTYNFFLENNFFLKDRIIWNYFGSMSFKSKFTNRHETILWYVKKNKDGSITEPYLNIDEVREKSREKDPRNNLFGKNPGNVWAVDRVAFGSSEQTSHIAVFPEEICERIVRACSIKGDILLDPFCGSGTFLKVAKSLGRKWIGIEISPLYFREANKRLAYQQPGEVRTIISQLIKDYMVQHECRRNLSQIIQYLLILFSGDKYAKYKNFYDDSLEGLHLNKNKENKEKKKTIWDVYEFYIGHKPHELITIIITAYLKSYKLAKHFNEVRLFNIGLNILKDIENTLKMSEVQIRANIIKILNEETESFRIEKEIVTLKSIERRIKAATKNTGEEEKPSLFKSAD
jgi:adenine-specific DNA-methyltransferase